jgi:Polysaccharide lyase
MRQAEVVRALAAAAVLGLTAGPSAATVLFHNTGTTSGWNLVFVEHQGSVAQVASPAFKGSTAVRVTQVYDPAYTGRYHSELVRNDGYRPGQMRFYGFALYIPSNWQSVSQGFNIAQFIADFGDTGCDDFMPSTMMWFTGSGLSTRVKQGTICNQSIRTFNNFASLSYGQWHRIEIQANWRSDPSGYIKVWVDGVKRLEQFNLATTISDPANRTFSFRVGMYANSWHDQGRMVGTQGTRTLYYDQIGIGTSFADADPNAW